MSVPLRKPGTRGPHDAGDPAYFLLEQGRKDPSKRSKTTVYDSNCYICKDPEFALMGLPLCYPCPTNGCGKHVAADDTVCPVGHDAQETYQEAQQ